MSAHTKGPWVASWSNDYLRGGAHVVRQCSDSGSIVAIVTYTGQHEDNVRLIALAPEMLTALRDSLDSLEYVERASPGTSGYGVRQDRIAAIRELLAKLEPTP